MQNRSLSKQKSKKETQQSHKETKIKLSNLHFEFLRFDKVEQATHLCTDGFLKMNRLWSKLGATYDDVYSVNRGRVIASCKAGWTCAMIDQSTNQIIAATTNEDLVDHLQNQSMPSHSKLFEVLGKYGKQIEGDYFESLKPFKRGDYMYNTLSAVKIEHAHGGITTKFWSLGLAYLKYSGYKVLLSRASNRITTKLIKLFGGEVVKTVMIREPGLQGQFFELLRLDLVKLTFESLSKYYEDVKEEDFE